MIPGWTRDNAALLRGSIVRLFYLFLLILMPSGPAGRFGKTRVCLRKHCTPPPLQTDILNFGNDRVSVWWRGVRFRGQCAGRCNIQGKDLTASWDVVLGAVYHMGWEIGSDLGNIYWNRRPVLNMKIETCLRWKGESCCHTKLFAPGELVACQYDKSCIQVPKKVARSLIKSTKKQRWYKSVLDETQFGSDTTLLKRVMFRIPWRLYMLNYLEKMNIVHHNILCF